MSDGVAVGQVWASTARRDVRDGRRRSEDGLLVGRQLPPGEGRNIGGHGWVSDRPFTTVTGDPRISKPGRHDPEQSGSQQADAVRVTLQEAAVLQGFPPDYPWAGTRTACCAQVGNAVPPPLAFAVLAALTGRRGPHGIKVLEVGWGVAA